jgi:RNA polymerase sigma factor (sigma-70 family)
MHGEISPKPSVLLVDDDPAVRESIGQALEDQGALVTAAATLDEAGDQLRHESFALVLTDLRLDHGTEGLEVARMARERAPDTKVVLFSGQDLSEIAQQAEDAGVDELLAKPLSIDALARILTDLGEEVEVPVRGPRSGRLSDAEGQRLLSAFVAGDQGAFAQIATSYRAMLFSVFLRWFRLGEEDAEDLCQEVMLQLVVKAAEIRNVRTWLLGTGINQAKKRIRHLIRERTLAERYIENLGLYEPDDDGDIRELISRGLDLLRPPDRRLLALIYIEGLSYQEVADRLGRPIGSIGPLRGRALKRLSRAVAELERPPKRRTMAA